MCSEVERYRLQDPRNMREHVQFCLRNLVQQFLDCQVNISLRVFSSFRNPQNYVSKHDRWLGKRSERWIWLEKA